MYFPFKATVKKKLHRINESFSVSAGGENRPAFYDIDKTYPALRILDRNYSTIRSELENILHHQDRIPRYHDIARYETYISGTVDPDKNWRVFMLHSLIGDPKKSRKMSSDDGTDRTNSKSVPSIFFNSRSWQVNPRPQRHLFRLSAVSLGLKSAYPKSSLHEG